MDTPLHRACVHGNIHGVEWLVEHNAAINDAILVRTFHLHKSHAHFVSSLELLL